jgi:hypothetical protein
VAALAGVPTIDAQPLPVSGALGVGEWLETDGGASANLDVADIGRVTVHPNSRLRLVGTRADLEHRVELAEGTIDALIYAPPRLFFVDTPSAVAVDLGCAYTLAVDDQGDGAIDVTLGRVMMQRGSRESTVPAGARCMLRAGLGPGTPFFADAPEAFRSALATLDTDSGRDDALDVVLGSAREVDQLTLWHLLPHVDSAQRERIIDRMTEFAPIPNRATREGVRRLARADLYAWWAELESLW